MTDLDEHMRRLHERKQITLRRHELFTLALLADQETTRYLRKSQRKNASHYTAAADLKHAGEYRRLSSEIRSQAEWKDS